MKKIHCFVCFFSLSVTYAFAQLSPGDLHKSHAFLEGVQNCTQCHVQGQKLDPENCLKCHTLLKEQINKGKGLHANSGYKQCSKCHVEHLGRNYELIYWGKQGKKAFDHSKTGYDLEGAHAALSCEKCHNESHVTDPAKLRQKKKDLNHTFLGLTRQCTGCHHDEHRGQMDSNCLKCHNTNSWKEVKGFNHNKTRFVLTGKHLVVKCEKCHITVRDNKFADDPTYLKFTIQKFNVCQDCHKDAHRGRFGSNCTKCHNTSGWSNYNANSFDHNKTNYPLLGKHAYLRCSQCHKAGQPVKIKRYQHCMDCHSDVHRGQFSDHTQKGACEECHTVQGFSPSSFTIEMHQACAYPLKGSHLAVPCLECHKNRTLVTHTNFIQFRFKDKHCINCHTDIHSGETNKVSGRQSCEFCHTVETWHKVSFDHDKTSFALQGKHKQISCTRCHDSDKSGAPSGRWHFQNISKNCYDCHNDAHNGQFSIANQNTDCGRCHSPIDWLADRFDHDRDARFSLKGAHEQVPCAKCHYSEERNGKKLIVYKPLDTRCESCHKNKLQG